MFSSIYVCLTIAFTTYSYMFTLLYVYLHYSVTNSGIRPTIV